MKIQQIKNKEVNIKWHGLFHRADIIIIDINNPLFSDPDRGENVKLCIIDRGFISIGLDYSSEHLQAI